MSDDGAAILIVKKKKGGGGGDGHHGGAWKVAYADFVTAMMAFFLLMWLLNATSEEQRKGIADYFSPQIPISESSSGGRSVFGGESAVSANTMARDGRGGTTDADGKGDGDQEGVSAPDPATVDPFVNAIAHRRAELEFQEAKRQAAEAEALAAAEAAALKAAEEAAALAAEEALLAEAAAEDDAPQIEAKDETDVLKMLEDGAMETADAVEGPGAGGYQPPEDFKIADREALEKALSDPNLSDQDRTAMVAAFEAIEEADREGELLQHLAMRVTPEGLLIEIAETAKTPLFSSGSAKPSEIMTALMQAIAPAIAELENRVAIVGHTDGRPFAAGSRRNNWTLSAERADAARRLLEEAGLAPRRLARISGAADRDPLVEDVYAPENRRIGLTLLRATSKRPRTPAPAPSGTPDATPRSNGGDDATDI